MLLFLMIAYYSMYAIIYIKLKINIQLSKRSQTQGAHTIRFHLRKVKEWAKVICGDRSQKSGYLCGGILSGKGHKGASEVLKVFSILIWVMLTQRYTYVKIHQAVNV